MQVNHLLLRYVICYGAFFLISILSKAHDGYKLFNEKGPVQNTGMLLGLQIAGILWLGVIPLCITGLSFTDIVFGKENPTLLSVLIFGFLLLATIVFALRQSQIIFGKIISNLAPIKIFNTSFTFKYILLRFLFLYAYEIFFRGYLLTASIQSLGIAPAIMINVSLYSLLHLPGDRKEMIVCIPFGILLCAVCVWLNAVWPAIVLHITLSMVYEINLIQKISKPINVLL